MTWNFTEESACKTDCSIRLFLDDNVMKQQQGWLTQILSPLLLCREFMLCGYSNL